MTDEKDKQIDNRFEVRWDYDEYNYCKSYWEYGDYCSYYDGYCCEHLECPVKKKYYKKYYGC